MNIDELKAQLIDHEGLRLTAYKDSVGKLTIGVGHNLDAKGISERAAMVILEDDIADVVADLDRNCPYWRNLDNVRQHVLADLCFNLGIVRLLGFKNFLLNLQAGIVSGTYEGAAFELEHSVWYRQVGRRGARLVQMMRDGQPIPRKDT